MTSSLMSSSRYQLIENNLSKKDKVIFFSLWWVVGHCPFMWGQRSVFNIFWKYINNPVKTFIKEVLKTNNDDLKTCKQTFQGEFHINLNLQQTGLPCPKKSQSAAETGTHTERCEMYWIYLIVSKMNLVVSIARDGSTRVSAPGHAPTAIPNPYSSSCGCRADKRVSFLGYAQPGHMNLFS